MKKGIFQQIILTKTYGEDNGKNQLLKIFLKIAKLVPNNLQKAHQNIFIFRIKIMQRLNSYVLVCN